jgi:putative FmdB family regulatory protein
MPAFEYVCPKCDYLFEELLIQTDEIQKYKDFHPCPKCGIKSPKVTSAANFSFKVKTPGNSGVHSIDYPANIDIAVGRSAEKKWKKYHERKAARDKFRKDHGVTAITEHNGKMIPTSSKRLEFREKALKTYSKMKDSDSSKLNPNSKLL